MAGPSCLVAGRAIVTGVADLGHWRSGFGHYRLGGGNARYLMRLQPGHHLPPEAADLFQKHIVRHRAAVQADQQCVGTRLVSLGDQAFGDFVRRTPGHVFGAFFDILHRHVVEVFPSESGLLEVFLADVAGGVGADIATLWLDGGFGEVAVAEQCPIEVQMVKAVFLDCPSLAVGHVGIHTDRQVIGGDGSAVLLLHGGVMANNVPRRPPGAIPGVMEIFLRAANSIDSRLPTIGIQTGGPGC